MMSSKRQSKTERLSHFKDSLLPLALFVIALLPRLLGLNTFLTADENLWLGRSRDFLASVVRQDWAGTLQTGHPGVTTMWTGSAGILYRYWSRDSSEADDLLVFIQNVSHEPPHISYIAPMRFSTVFLMAVFVSLFYFLTARLFQDRRIGLIAGLLLALDPFHIALSRVLHHDALATMFMILALLPLLGYWLRDWSIRWLIFSGVMAGLGFLSKSPAMFLMPFCALLGCIWAIRRWRQGEWRGWPDMGRLVGSGLLWGGVAWLTFFLLWPAMWVIPGQTLALVFSTGTGYAVEGHYFGNFFLGEVTNNPGPLFYPLNVLLRVTPVVLLGLLGWGAIYGWGCLKPSPATQSHLSYPLVSISLAYILLFVLFMSLGAKKQDRYILPIFPMLDVVAAVGITHLTAIVLEQLQIKVPLRKIVMGGVVGLACLWQMALVVANYPYYFTYYNPLTGGISTAATLTTVGWGEGLDQAADYLNSLPNAAETQVLAWYPFAFGPFFNGQTIGYIEILESDYIVLYHSQVQRNELADGALEYFLHHHQPLFTVTLKGVDYAYIYRMPMTRRGTWEVSGVPKKAFLLGMSEKESMVIEGDKDQPSLLLYWQNLGLSPEERWWVALQSRDGLFQGWYECQLRPDFVEERSLINFVLESQCPVDQAILPAGVYHVRVGIGPGDNSIIPIAFPAGEAAINIGEDGRLTLLTAEE